MFCFVDWMYVYGYLKSVFGLVWLGLVGLYADLSVPEKRYCNASTSASCT